MKTLFGFVLCAIALLAQNPNAAVFPGAVATDNDLLVQTDAPNARTTLALAINATATSIKFATAPFVTPLAITIDGEILLCTSHVTVTYTCSRHFSGTTATAHGLAAVAHANVIAYHHNQLAAETKVIETALANVTSDISAATFAAACAAATPRTLLVSKVWTALSTQACAPQIAFYGGGKIQPANGQTVTIAIQSAPRSQICDISLGGNCIITSVDGAIYPEWYGAAPATDSTTAFQAALNNVNLTNANLRIVLPAYSSSACYNISATLTYTGARTFDGSLIMEGEINSSGGKGSCMQWTGAAAGTMIHFTDAHRPRFRHISFLGNSLAGIVFWLDASDDLAFSTQSADWLFEDDSFAGATGTGSIELKISHTGCTNADVANGQLREVVFAGNNSQLETGLDFQCGGNSKNITLIDCVFVSLGTGYKGIGAGDGYTTLQGGYFGANALDISQALGRLNVIGVGSEGSTKFIFMGAGANLCSLNLQGSYWSGIAATNDRVIETQGCAMSLIHNNLSNGRVAGVSLPKIVLDNGFAPTCAALCTNVALFSTGNWFANADTTHGAYYDSAGQDIGGYYGGYFNQNSNQAPIEIIGDYGGPNTFTFTALPNYSFAQPRQFTPASSSANCTPPQMAYDANSAYACTAANTWVSFHRDNTFGAANTTGTLFSGVPLTGATFPTVRGFGLAATDVDLYTAPTGKRVLVMTGGGINITGTATNCTFELKSGGTYYKIAAPLAFGGVGVTNGAALTIVLEPTESISIKCDAASNVNISVAAVQFDNTATLKTVKLLGPATGLNTLYTVPALKTALLMAPAGPSWAGVGNVLYGTAAVAGGLVVGCVIPSGQTVACVNTGPFQIGAVTSGANTRGIVFPAAAAAGFSMAAGDKIALGVTTGDATQIAWTNVLEF
jgi:hypothetical protein